MQAYFEVKREKDSDIYATEQINDNTPPHFHSHIEVIYVTEGEITVTINGNTSTLKKGDISAAINYDIHTYSTEKFSKSIVLLVPCEIVNSFVSLSSGKTFGSPFLISNSSNKEILHCLKMILSEPKKDNLLKMKGYIYIILSLLIDNLGFSDSKSLSSNYLPKKILLYMQENYLEKISLLTISEKFGYNKYYFSKFFNTFFGCGFTEYINTLRARHASILLSEGKLSIMEIALDSGFENQRTFNRAFISNFGVTPSDYRKKSHC